MNNIRNVEAINNEELNHGIFGGVSKSSWHDKYKNSAWIFMGGFAFELSEGDIICVCSQFGEIEDIHLVREKDTNKSKGFAFIKYEDQRSTILAVDNFNGTKLLGRTLRCDHVENYRLPKHIREREEEELKNNGSTSVSIGPGHAYKNMKLENDFTINDGIDLWRKEQGPKKDEKTQEEEEKKKDKKKHKKRKKHKKDSDEERKSHKRDRDEEEYSDEVDSRRKRNRRENDHYSSDDSRKKRHRSEHSRYVERSGTQSTSNRGTERTIPQTQDGKHIDFVDFTISKLLTLPHFTLTDGAALSWRGNRDPQLPGQNKPKSIYTSMPSKISERGELTGIAGFGRTR